MYFGWVTPALMALIAANLPLITNRPLSPRFKGPIIMSLVSGLLAFVPFLLYRYTPANLCGRSIPLSVIAAGFNVIGWYWFVLVYWQTTRGAARNYPLQLWDGALVSLIFASMCDWGLAIITRLGIEDPFRSLAMTHIFLDTFSCGWFLLGVLGVAYVTRPNLAGDQLPSWSINLVVIGMPVLFLLGMPLHVVPPAVRWLGAAGASLVAAALLGHVWVLWKLAVQGEDYSVNDRQGRLERSAEPVSPVPEHCLLNTDYWQRWRLPLFFLALTALTLVATGIPSVARWVAASGVRVLHLHWMLLGFVTLGLVTGAQEKWGRTAVAGWPWIAASTIILIISLLPLTTLWPVVLRGE